MQNNKTTHINPKSIKPAWHLIDASEKVLGKVAVDITNKLMGKNKPQISPNNNIGDHVIVINAKKVAVTGKKLTDKLYIHHTGYPKGLRTEKLEDLLKRSPTDVIKKAVSGMLPKNKLRRERMKNLHIFAGDQHPHQGNLGK